MTLSLPGPDYERAVLDLQITLPDIPSVSHRPRYLSLTPYKLPPPLTDEVPLPEPQAWDPAGCL